MMLFYVMLALIVLLIATLSIFNGEALWISIACWSFFVVSILAIADAALSYVMLGENKLQMRKNFRKTNVARNDIESVAVAKGCPVTLILKNGKKIEVPSLGANNIGNSLRAWIRAN